MVALQEYDSLHAMYNTQRLTADHTGCDEQATLAFLERGRFHCLYQLGQLDSLIDQVIYSALSAYDLSI